MLRSSLIGVLLIAGVFFGLSGCSKSGPVSTSAGAASIVPADQRGTITIEAMISSGNRFALYYNNNWDKPVLLPLVPGSWSTYQFEVGSALSMFRMDFSDNPEAVAVIRKIRISLPGDRPRLLNLEDLTKWMLSQCSVTYNAQDGTATIRALGPAHLMSSVNTNLMRTE